jgi:hypothetical protein
LPLQKKSLLFGRLRVAEVSDCFATDISRLQNVANINYYPSTPFNFDTFGAMSLMTTEERLAQHDHEIVDSNRLWQELSLRIGEIQAILLNPDRLHVLPSVSNPASETSQLSEVERDPPPIPPKKSHAVSTCVKPLNPSKFLGDRTKGHAFLNSCNLYFVLTLLQFADDHAKIMWVFLFMKTE